MLNFWNVKALVASSTIVAGIAQLIVASFALSPAQAAPPTATCGYNPDSEKPNPLGMRTLVTLEEADGNTTVKYEQFPSPVGGGNPPTTIASERQLVFYKTNIAAARQLLLKNPQYYNELRGYTDAEGFKAINDTLLCRSAQATKPPISSSSAIANLPDGDYRFWNGKASKPISDEELLKQGGVLFVFHKQGKQVLGSFGQIDNVGSCIKGTVSGNTVTGIAVSYEESTNPSSRNNTFFDPGGFLKLGRWQKGGERGQYENSTLNLAKLNRINLGSSKPPKSCP